MHITKEAEAVYYRLMETNKSVVYMHTVRMYTIQRQYHRVQRF